jgi:hypothetical protein
MTLPFPRQTLPPLTTVSRISSYSPVLSVSTLLVHRGFSTTSGSLQPSHCSAAGHRVAGHRVLAARVVPAEGEAGWRVDGHHDDRAALVPELHVAVSARFDHEVYPVGEPLAYI